MKQKLAKLTRQLLGFIPTLLPQGASEFSAWADNIANTYTLPTQDKESLKFVLASLLMHLPPNASHRSNYYFVVAIRAAAAKQVAGAAFYEIKETQKRLAEEAAKKAQDESASQTA